MLSAAIQATHGCGGGSSHPPNAEPDSPVAPATVSFSAKGHGHFMGETTIAGENFHTEALLTVDGEVWIYIGGPPDGSGAGPSEAQLHPKESTLFVGNIDDIQLSTAAGSGAVIGQICDAAGAPFCDQPAPAQLRLVAAAREHLTELTGELSVETAPENERWAITLTSYSAYYASRAHPPGDHQAVFKEYLAPFAHAEELHLEIDPDGQMGFASALNGCTGNGTIQPHLDGLYDVYDVRLQITGCNDQFSYFNSEFSGLATETQGGYWDYDIWLVIFLAAPDGAPPRPALNMRAYAMEESQ